MQETPVHNNGLETNKVELYDGVYMNIPETNNTKQLFSFEIDTYRKLDEGKDYI